MRILLVRPPVPKHTIGLKHIMICEPLELEYVAAGLAGHDVQILDLIIERDFKKRLRSFSPEVIGTSAYISGVNEAIRICREAKQWKGEVLTVVGGVQASRSPEDYRDPSVDCVVLGDGTTVMPEVVDAFEAGRALTSIPGLALPRNGGLERTEPRPYMPHPDTLPFPRRDLVSHLAHRYYYLFHRPVALLKTTWGCWYKCNFCYTWRITGGTPHSRSPASIVDELAGIRAREIYIVDDIFLINRPRLQEIARLLRERRIDKHYLVYGRADFIAENEDIIAEWAALGLRAVFIGLEAATDPELDSMHKLGTVDHNRRAIAILRKCGVEVYGSLIAQPGYVKEDWQRLKDFIDENDLYYLNLSPLTPMPGTAIWDDYKDKMTVSREAHGLWDFSHILLDTKVPLKEYYRSLLGVYMHCARNPLRARRLGLPTAPGIPSPEFLRLWTGMLKVAWQLRYAHRHHHPRELAKAEDRGRESAWPIPEASRHEDPEHPHPTPPSAPRSQDAAPGDESGGHTPVPDPFDGFHEALTTGARSVPDYLDMARARRLLRTIGRLRENDVHTYMLPLGGHGGARVKIHGRDHVMASSYDYLGLIGHPGIEEASAEAIRKYGTSTGGVRLLTGTCELHRELESALARFKGVEAAITFSSGYLANLAAISGIMNPKDRTIIDEKAHRSIIDGCRLAGTRLRRFAHNDAHALEEELKRAHPGRTLVIVEGIYSMDGDLCPLPELVALKGRYGFTLMVDESHSIGVLGETGRGVNEHFGVPAQAVDIWMGSLSKAIPANGGFLAGSQATMVYLQHEAAPFIFSAAPCPAPVASALAALRVIDSEPSRLQTLRERTSSLRDGLNAMGFDTGKSSSPIVPVILGSNERTFCFARGLLEHGILGNAVIHPAVPRDQSRLRLCAMASHSKDDIDAILTACAAVAEKEKVS